MAFPTQSSPHGDNPWLFNSRGTDKRCERLADIARRKEENARRKQQLEQRKHIFAQILPPGELSEMIRSMTDDTEHILESEKVALNECEREIVQSADRDEKFAAAQSRLIAATAGQNELYAALKKAKEQHPQRDPMDVAAVTQQLSYMSVDST